MINVSGFDPGINHVPGGIRRCTAAGRQPQFELHALMQVCQLRDRQGGRGGT